MRKDEFIGLCRVFGCFEPSVRGLDVCLRHQKEFAEAKLQKKGKAVKSSKKGLKSNQGWEYD